LSNIAGLLGVGGGLIIVPVLLYILAFEVQEAVLMHTVIISRSTDAKPDNHCHHYFKDCK
jgi:uncharacterized membrane protein YfcA